LTGPAIPDSAGTLCCTALPTDVRPEAWDAPGQELRQLPRGACESTMHPVVFPQQVPP